MLVAILKPSDHDPVSPTTILMGVFNSREDALSAFYKSEHRPTCSLKLIECVVNEPVNEYLQQ